MSRVPFSSLQKFKHVLAVYLSILHFLFTLTKDLGFMVLLDQFIYLSSPFEDVDFCTTTKTTADDKPG